MEAELKQLTDDWQRDKAEIAQWFEARSSQETTLAVMYKLEEVALLREIDNKMMKTVWVGLSELEKCLTLQLAYFFAKQLFADKVEEKYGSKLDVDAQGVTGT